MVEWKNAEVVFESSGTTGTVPSKHHVADTSLYRESFLRGFYGFYGSPEDLCILALLPSYLERSGSSLVYMADHLIRWSEHSDSGFYLDNLEELASVLKTTKQRPAPHPSSWGKFRLAGPGQATSHVPLGSYHGDGDRRDEG